MTIPFLKARPAAQVAVFSAPREPVIEIYRRNR